MLKGEISLAKIRENLAQLVLAAQQGDSESTEQLLASCSQSIYYIAYKMFKNKESAEDMTQEALMAIWKRLGSLKEPEAFYGWADRVAVNLCLDKLRKKGVQIDPSAGEPEVYEALPEANEAMLPESALDQGETQRLVNRIIDGLPEAQRMCVLLYYFREMNVADIAKAMACSEGTVKSRLSAARDKIRTGVLTLERKDGVKLYALPLLPFLLGDSAAAWTPDLVEKLMPAGVSAVGAAAAATAADGTAKTGIGGFVEAVKAKLAALSAGAKVGAGAAAVAVTATAVVLTTSGGEVRPFYEGIYYSEMSSSAPAQDGMYNSMYMYVCDQDGITLPPEKFDLSYEILESTQGVTVTAERDPSKFEPDNLWFKFLFSNPQEDEFVRLKLKIDGKSHDLEFHQVMPGCLPGVTYKTYPLEVTPGEPIRLEDFVAELPDGLEFSEMRAVYHSPPPSIAGPFVCDANGVLTLNELPEVEYQGIQWTARDESRDITYCGYMPIVWKGKTEDATSAADAAAKFRLYEMEYYIEQPPAPVETEPEYKIQLLFSRTDGEPAANVQVESAFSKDLGLSVKKEEEALWLVIPENAPVGTTELSLTLDGEVHELTVHIVEHGQLPGVTYASDRVTMTPGQTIDAASLFTSVPEQISEFTLRLTGCGYFPGGGMDDKTYLFDPALEGEIGFDTAMDNSYIDVDFVVGQTRLVGHLPIDVLPE